MYRVKDGGKGGYLIIQTSNETQDVRPPKIR